ncbi:MAG: exodeoxyribonuclease VII small subunit [Bacteroidales bacterium]|nr:exodeoxyribonuclease VII small subunit [Bacteroidales bacterium]
MSESTYTAAMSELESILAELRADNCDVDRLAERTRRAVELLQLCRNRLTTTEEELSAILKSLQSPDQNPA